MPNDVCDVVTLICEKEGGMSPEEATKFVKNLQNKKKYVVETWYVLEMC